MKQPATFEFTITGFVIGMALIAMMSGTLAYFVIGVQDSAGIEGNTSINKYNQTQDLYQYSKDIRDATDVQQQTGILDVIGGYFSSGYAAIKTAISSFGLFENMMDDASQDIEYFAFFKNIIVTIIIIAIFLGVLIAALLKWKV